MRPLKLTKIAMTLAALAAGASAHAQEPVEETRGSTAIVTLSLTEYLTDAALFKKDEAGKIIVDPVTKSKTPVFENEFTQESLTRSISTYESGAKIVTYRISNKEFLEALAEEEGLIDDIKGWSLIMLEVAGESNAFITKKGIPPNNVPQYINVDQYLAIFYSGAYAIRENSSEVDTTVFGVEPKPDIVTRRESGSYQGKWLVGVESQFAFTKLDLQGVLNDSGTLRTYTTGTGSARTQDTQWIPGARSITSITGSLLFEDEVDPQPPSVIIGSISIGAGKQVLDLSPFGLAP